MTTMFDIGDKISVMLTGEIVGYSMSKHGDCYTIEVSDSNDRSLRVYMSSNDLKSATKVKEKNQNCPMTFYPEILEDVNVDGDLI